MHVRAGGFRDHLRLLRPANALVAGGAAYVGAILTGAEWVPSREIGAAMVASFAFAAAGNVRNDLGDIAIDRLAHPDRPLARGSIRPRVAREMALGLYLLALAAGILVSWIGFALVVAAIPIMEGYERWAKARGLPGNVLIGLLTGAPFVLGSLATGALSLTVLSVALLAALATAGREVLKDVEDLEADVGFRNTLPIRVGIPQATLVAALFLMGAILLSPLPWFLETVLGERYLLAVGAADACFLVAAMSGARAPGRAQRLAKFGMVVALLALVLGRVSS